MILVENAAVQADYCRINTIVQWGRCTVSHKTVLFVCEKNTCRSQMAEGWLRSLAGDRFRAFSAGISPGPLDPLAVRVMSEAGVDISGQETHSVRDFLAVDIDIVVTVCSTAAEKCPTFPGHVEVICHAFDDPPKLTRVIDDLNRKLAVYRRVRDEIRVFLEAFVEQHPRRDSADS